MYYSFLMINVSSLIILYQSLSEFNFNTLYASHVGIRKKRCVYYFCMSLSLVRMLLKLLAMFTAYGIMDLGQFGAGFWSSTGRIRGLNVRVIKNVHL